MTGMKSSDANFLTLPKSRAHQFITYVIEFNLGRLLSTIVIDIARKAPEVEWPESS